MNMNPIKNGAEVLLEQLDLKGADCIFASPIAVMAPIWEALARRENELNLPYFRCRHELLAVSLACGYYKATGRSQIVFSPDVFGSSERIDGLAHGPAGTDAYDGSLSGHPHLR